MTIIEYILLRKMIALYYKNGPFAFKGSYKLITTKDVVIDHLKEEKSISLKPLQDSILIFFTPSISSFYIRGEFLTQRVILRFRNEGSNPELQCEARPFYSSFLLATSMVLFMIFNIVLFNQYANIPMKIIGVIVACFIGLAIFLPFRPRRNIINRIKKLTT
jgi:ABC-type xylose transport system permease subunit